MPIIVAVILALFIGQVSASTLPAAPLDPDEAFAMSVDPTGDGIELRWKIADGYYLYRDHFAVTGQDGEDLRFTVSPGEMKSDPGFGDVEVLFREARVNIAEPGNGALQVTYQGCQDGGICYRPETRLIDPASGAVTTSIMGPSTAGVAEAPRSLAEAGIIVADEADAPSSILRGGNVAWIVLSFVGFGLLLAFTPCVFPIYPIVLGMLGTSRQGTSAGRGFVLSAAYVASLAFAFALVGAVVGWTGQNLQFALQSPVMSIAMAVLFLVLAASTFGMFELQLPRFLTTRVSSMKTGRGSVGSAAALGFTSSLIVGPCVTAPLAGALIYIAQGGDWRTGALALFSLGIGKGLPLVALATFGGRLLPKAGRWMEAVRRVFGYGFIGMAVWIAAPLLPQGMDLALYAALALAAIADLILRSRIGARKAAATVLAVGIGAISFGAVNEAGARISLSTTVPAPSPLSFTKTDSMAGLIEAFDNAQGRPVFVYITADWCVICRTIERSVLPDETVVEALGALQLVKFDATDFNAETQALFKELNVAGPPTMIFFDAARREVAGTRLIGAVTADALAQSADSAGAAR